MTHEQAKIITDIGKWEIQYKDEFYYQNKKYLCTQRKENGCISAIHFCGEQENGIAFASDTYLTLIPQEKHLLQLLRDNNIKVDIMAMAVCLFKFNYDTIDYTSLGGFPIKDNNIHEALTDAVMYCIENNLITKESE